MSKNPHAPGLRSARITLYILFSVGFILSVTAFLPSASRATRRPAQTTRAATGKHSRLEFVPGHILVRYKSETAAKAQQRALTELSVEGRSLPVRIERFGGSEMIAGLRLAHVAEQETMSAIAALRAQPDVLYAEPDIIMHATLTPNDPCFPANSMTGCQSTSLYGLNKIGAPAAWNTNTGSSNVVVGVVDQGIDINHQDLAANIWTNPSPGAIPGITGDLHGYNFVDNNGTVFSGSVNEFHGTHVAGTIGAVGNNSIGVVGVNWQTRLMSLKFLDANGGGSTSDALRA